MYSEGRRSRFRDHLKGLFRVCHGVTGLGVEQCELLAHELTHRASSVGKWRYTVPTQVRAPGGSYAADVLGPSLLAGVGSGPSFVPVTIAAVTGTKQQEAGLAPG